MLIYKFKYKFYICRAFPQVNLKKIIIILFKNNTIEK